MNFSRKIMQGILLGACFFGLETASATIVNFTDNGNGVSLGQSFSEVGPGGITINVSAYSFPGASTTPTSSNTQRSIIEAFGNYGIGIGGGNNPEHTADNRGNNEFFLVEFSQSVMLNWASISEWGNGFRSRSGGDSDVDYWGGAGSFSFGNLGTRFGNNVNANSLGNGERRRVTFNNGLGSVDWLLFGPEASSSNAVNDFIKLRKIDYTVAPVPLPATVWLMGSALLGLARLNRKRTSAV